MLYVLAETKGKPCARAHLVDKSDLGLDGMQTIVVVERLGATNTVWARADHSEVVAMTTRNKNNSFCVSTYSKQPLFPPPS